MKQVFVKFSVNLLAKKQLLTHSCIGAIQIGITFTCITFLRQYSLRRVRVTSYRNVRPTCVQPSFVVNCFSCCGLVVQISLHNMWTACTQFTSRVRTNSLSRLHVNYLHRFQQQTFKGQRHLDDLYDSFQPMQSATFIGANSVEQPRNRAKHHVLPR